MSMLLLISMCSHGASVLHLCHVMKAVARPTFPSPSGLAGLVPIAPNLPLGHPCFCLRSVVNSGASHFSLDPAHLGWLRTSLELYNKAMELYLDDNMRTHACQPSDGGVLVVTWMAVCAHIHMCKLSVNNVCMCVCACMCVLFQDGYVWAATS